MTRMTIIRKPAYAAIARGIHQHARALFVRIRMASLWPAAVTMTLLVGCQTPATLQVPKAASPSIFKGQSEGMVVRPEWWLVFDDAELRRLATRLDDGNLELQAALARADQAYAALGLARADRVPSINANGSVQRSRSSENEQSGGSFPNYASQYRAGLALGWEIDLWGRVRKLVEAGQADAQVAEALVEDVRLALRGQLARNYFALRTLDEEQQVLRDAVTTREANLKLAQRRFDGGITPELDVARAATELAATRSELASLQGPRTRLENAIAVLLGEAPADFRLDARGLSAKLPGIRAGLPMETLAARPDVAAAKARLIAAQARVGVAQAEFFPRVSLVGSGGLSSIQASNFVKWSSRTFTLGPEVSVPIFQGGRLRANEARARAAYAEAVANYRQTVLNALGDVENAMADLAALRNQTGAQDEAVRAAERALALSTRRYEAGLVSSIEVIDAVREQLNAQRRAVQIRGQQFESTVQLIQGLGGGLSTKHTST